MNKHFPLGDLHPIKYFYLVASVTGVLFAFVSQSESTPLIWHFIIWQLQAFIPITFLITVHIGCLELRFFNRFKPWQQLCISGVVGSLLFAPFALLIDIYIVGEGLPNNVFYELVDETLAVTPPVTIFWILINLPCLHGLEYKKRLVLNEPQSHKHSRSHMQPQPAFLALTPITDIDEVVYLSAQLHYLEVATADDKYLILYSLAKAIDEIPSHLGIQTHRSHWVALNHIKSFNKTGRQGEMLMQSGVKIPISRANLSKINTLVGLSLS